MPQDAWSDKDERQYHRVRRTELELGKSEELAEEIAWRTVQMQRMSDGREETARPSPAGENVTQPG